MRGHCAPALTTSERPRRSAHDFTIEPQFQTEELAAPRPEIGGAADVARLQLRLARRPHRLILRRSAPRRPSRPGRPPLSKPTNETSQSRPSWAAPTPAIGAVSPPGPDGPPRGRSAPRRRPLARRRARPRHPPARGRGRVRDGRDAAPRLPRAPPRRSRPRPRSTQLLAQVDALPLELSAITARAFTLFFLLINTAEQVHRVRRARALPHQAENAEPQPASARWAMRSLQARRALAPQEVERAIARARRAPGAHRASHRVHAPHAARPPGARRRRAARARADAARRAPRRSRTQLDGEVELLWLTSEVRQDRPSVRDEVSTVLWYLETRLLDAGAKAREALVRAFEEEFGVLVRGAAQRRAAAHRQLGRRRPRRQSRSSRPTSPSPRRAARATRSSAATRAALDGSRRAAVGVGAARCRRATSCASRSRRRPRLLPDVWEANRRRNADEPVRLKLTFMRGARGGDAPAHRGARRRALGRRAGGVPPTPRSSSTTSSSCARTSCRAGAMHATRTTIDPLLATRARARLPRLPDGRARPRRQPHGRASPTSPKQLGLPDVRRRRAAPRAARPPAARQRARPALRRDDARARHLPRRLHDPGRDERATRRARTSCR